ncbi:MAG: TOPRIM nucleotidyl transferase/hydrolase domain-containing protein, partial [Actinomycetota bacterium]
VSGVGVRTASGLSNEDLIKVRRLVERPYGQVLFAKLVVISDGATERGALPVFARVHWAGTEMEGKCVTLVDPQSLSQADHLVRLLEKLGIPWLVLADGDAAANQHLQAIGTLIGRAVDGTAPEVVQLKAGEAFEQCLMSCGVRAAIEQGIAAVSTADALANFKAQNAQLSDDELVLKFLTKHKGTYGAAVAEAMAAVLDVDGNPTMPTEVRELLGRADAILEASA